MKKFIAILLAGSLGFAAGAYAKPDDAKKKNKPGPPPQLNVNAGPKTKVNVQRNVPHPNPNSALVNPAKIQKKEFKQQQKELRKSSLGPTRTPGPNVVATDKFRKNTKSKEFTQPNQLPVIQKNQKTIVNNQNAANLERIRARYKNFHAKRNSSIASVQFNQNYRIQNAQNWSGPQYRVFQTYRPRGTTVPGGGRVTAATSCSSAAAGITGMPAIGIPPGATMNRLPTIRTTARSTSAITRDRSIRSWPIARPLYRSKVITRAKSTV